MPGRATRAGSKCAGKETEAISCFLPMEERRNVPRVSSVMLVLSYSMHVYVCTGAVRCLVRRIMCRFNTASSKRRSFFLAPSALCGENAEINSAESYPLRKEPQKTRRAGNTRLPVCSTTERHPSPRQTTFATRHRIKRGQHCEAGEPKVRRRIRLTRVEAVAHPLCMYSSALRRRASRLPSCCVASRGHLVFFFACRSRLSPAVLHARLKVSAV